MNIKIQSMKQLLTRRWALLLMLIAGLSASADNKLYIADFTIDPGETKTIEVIIENTDVVTSLNFDMQLPDGLQYVEGSLAKSDRVTGRGITLDENFVGGKYRLGKFGGNSIAAGSGAVLTLQVKNVGLPKGNSVIQLSAIAISDESGNRTIQSSETASTTVTRTPDPDLKTCSFSVNSATIEVVPGEEYQINVILNNEGVNNVAAMSGTLTLPQGMAIVPGTDGNFIYTDRTPEPLAFQFKEIEGALNFVLSSSSNTKFVGTSGVLFSFVVKADNTLAVDSEILLSNLTLGTNSAASQSYDNITINVTNTTAQQLNEDKQTFEDNKEPIKAAVDALAQDGDSEATQKLIADAKAAIDATEYDETKTLDENMSVLQAIVENTEDQIAEQRAKDADAAQLEADKAAFEAYKTSKIVEAEGLAQADDPEACASIIADAVSAINSLAYDETKTLEQNKAAADELIAKLKKDLAKERPVQGDITGSGEVDSDDVEAYVDILLGNDENYSGVDLWVINATDTPEQYETYKSLDVNGDGYFDVADAQAILNIAAGLNPDGSLPENSRAFTASAKAAIKAVATAMNGMTRYTLSLDGNIGYSAFQMSVKLEDGMTVANCEAEGVALRTSTAADGTLRVVGMGNGTGSLLTLDVVGDGNVTFANARLATIDAESVSLVVSQTTGINAVNAGASAAGSYDLGGKLQKNVQKGVNIIVGADGSVKKALIK